MEARRDVFQALADPTRREIINMIAHRSMNLNAITESFEVTRQAISLHIKILSECGIIAVKRQGRECICSIQGGKLEEVSDWLDKFRKIWEQRFNQLDKVLSTIKKKENR